MRKWGREIFYLSWKIYMIRRIVYAVREKSNKIPSQNHKTIVLYNNIVHMYIFDIEFYGLHIAPSWYGLSYAFGFIICYFFIKKQFSFRNKIDIDNLLTFVFFWIILWGRIWYIFLYNLSFFIENPSFIFKIWEWWMSFHGWLVGTIISVYLFCKIYKYDFWGLIDKLAIITPIAIGLWRIWNWINKELPWYAPYDGFFPMNILWKKHFPSPLFEMLLEGILLFIIMYSFYKFTKKYYPGFFSWIFLIWYSVMRIIAEQYRLPDSHIGYIFWTNYMTLWILYTVPLCIAWILIIALQYKNYNSTTSLPGNI